MARLLLPLFLLLACTPPASDLRPTDTDDTGSVDDTGDTGDTGDTDQPAGDEVVPPPPLPGAAVARITDDIDLLVDASPATHGVHIVDLDNGQVVYTRGADRWLKPASNTKLFTTAVALDELGPDHEPEIVALAEARPSGGVLRGDLVVLGRHDGSWSSWLHPTPDVPAERVAAGLRRAGVTQIQGRVVVRGEYVYEPYRFGTLDPAVQRDAAAAALQGALAAAGISFSDGVVTESSLDAPPGWIALTTWRGASLEAVSATINRISHNELADNLARHVGWQLDGRSSYAGSEAAAAAWLADQGLDTSGLVLHDGSGLSHDNRVTAELVVGLFAAVHDSPSAPAWMRSLSVAGYDGTLAGRMTGPDTLGRFLGKTGTLNGVICTSGVLHHRYDGHRYAISILANGVSDNATTRSLHDRMVGVMARNWREGSAPRAPELEAAIAEGDSVSLTWSIPADTRATEVWTSPDGGVWRREDAVLVEGTEATLGELPRGVPTHVRLVAVGGSGRSVPSDVLSVVPGPGPRLLVVDGNDRWDHQDAENPVGQGHDLVARVVEALPDVAVDSISNESVVDGLVDLSDYDAVVWLLGEESTEDETFDADEQLDVRAYVEGGGALVVSGAEVAWDLDLMGDEVDRAFARDVLGGSYAADDADTWLVEPAEAAFARVPDVAFHLPGYLVAHYPDVLRPTANARISLSYAGGIGGAAAIRRNDAPVLWLGFPVEIVDDVADREAILGAALDVLEVR